MNQHVHFRLTRRWAIGEGFREEEAERIAQADVGVDSAHPGSLNHPLNWGYHYRLFGAEVFAARHLRAALRTGSLDDLGIALHEVQDSIAHGWLGLLRHAIDPGTDLWDRRSPAIRERIERRSREMLGRVAAAMGRVPRSGGDGAEPG